MKIIRINLQILLIILVSLFPSKPHLEDTQMVSPANLWQSKALAAGGTFEHTYHWHTFYGSEDGLDDSSDIVADENGNSFLIGASRASFNGDRGTPPLQPHGGGNIAYPESSQIMILKLNRNGAYQWHTFYGNQSNLDIPNNIAIDSQGNIYITGVSWSVWNGDNNSSPINSPGLVFVLKLNHQGVYQWHTFFCNANDAEGIGIALDDADNVYVTGYSEEDCLGPADQQPIHHHSGGDNNPDLFVLKLNKDGIYQWHTFYGSGSGSMVDDEGSGIVVGSSGYIYVAGSSESTWGSPKHGFAGGWSDVFILRLNPDGSYDWNTFYGGDSSDVGYNLAYYDNAVYLTGYSWGSWQADGHAPLHGYNGHKDILILKLDAAGNYLWHTFYGGDSFDEDEDIAVNPNGVYSSAHSYSTWVGDGDSPPLHECSAGGRQALLKLSHSGAYGWHTFYCGYSHGITIDGHEDILLAGDASFTWLGDGDEQPLHAHTVSGRNYSVTKLSQPDEQAEISISGGTLSYSSGSGRSTTVQVPPNAITDPITLVYTQWDANNPPVGMGYAGLGFTLKAYEGQILQPGFSFSVPVTVTATYTDNDIIGLDEDTLLLYNWDDATNTWKDVALTCSPPSSYERFPTENRLVVPICHLSRFALFANFHNRLFLPLILKK